MIKFPARGGMPPEQLALLTSQVDEHKIDAKVQKVGNMYFFTKVGLLNYGGRLVAKQDLSAIVQFLGEDLMGCDDHYSSGLLLYKLMRRGIVSITETLDGSHIWFDVSSKKNRAYIRLAVRRNQPHILAYICADGIDKTILGKVQLIGTALANIIRECSTPRMIAI